MKIVITAPSLNENENVSGISSLVRSLVQHGSNSYTHFEAGRRDGVAADANWLNRQAALPIRFFRLIRFVRPNIVHLNTAFIPLAIVRDAALAGSARLAQAPVLLHIHGGPFVMGEFTNRAVAAAARLLVKLSAAIIVFSEREAKRLRRRFPEAKIFILPNGVPLSARIERPANERRRKKIIFFGRLHRSKGLTHIVDAVAELAAQNFDFDFICYGAGPERESFVAAMFSILGSKFSYRGVARGVAKWQALIEADIFFLPSRDEGLPLALLEAMAAGCIPVVAASGGVADVIDDGQNGFLIEAGNTTQTVGRLKFLLSENDIALGEMRRRAKRTIEEKYNFTDYLAQLDAIYADVATRNQGNDR